MILMQEDRAAKIIRLQNQLEGLRTNFESQWREVNDYVDPAPNYFQGNTPTPGQKVGDKVFDDTATEACDRFVAAIDSTLTPRSQRWHRLSINNQKLKDSQITQQYLDDVTDIMFGVRYDPRANFASQCSELYRSLGKYGTCCLFIDDDLGVGIRYKSIPLAQIYFSENAVGRIDTVYRKFEYTARQAADAFGEDELPDIIRKKIKTEPETKYWFIHAVYPNDEHNGKIGSFKYTSCYVCIEGKKIVSEGGYRTFPYAVSRYKTEIGEIYGRSPAMSVLPTIKMINRMRKTVIQSGEKYANPPMLLPDDAEEFGFSGQPGSINYGLVGSDGRPMAMPLQMGGNLNINLELIQDAQQTINNAFLVNLFQILVEAPQMTATEVEYRQQEKGQMLAPTMGRQQSELFSVMIERELDILSAAGVLPPMPQELIDLGGLIEIEYEAPLNKIMRSSEAISILKALQTAAGLAQFDPNILKMFNMPEAMRIICDIWGVPADVLKSPEELAQMDAAAAQQAQVQQLLQAAPVVAQSAKDMATAQQIATKAGPGQQLGVGL